MRHFSSDDQATIVHPSHGGERWSLQGNLGRGRWRRWFRVAGTGEESDVEVDPEPENWASVLEIIREKQYGKRVSQFTVNQDQSAFMPLSSLEVGTERSQAICRIARYFSIDTLGELVDSINASPNAADYQNANLLKEIFTIPEQIATEIFKGGGDPLDALKNLNESQLSKLNPIAIGTGFLVGGTHLMTNNHVISDAMEAAECVAQFNYVKDAFGGVRTTVDYELDPSFLFITNPDLDYTLVQLKAGMFTRQAGYVFGWLQLSGDDTLVVPGISGEQVLEMQGQGNREPISDIVQAAKAKPIPGDRVFLVQHPKGQQKQIVQNDNRVLDYDQQGLLKNFLRYTAASDYGSSGSPVFNTNWDLVALHHAVLAPAPEPEKTPRLGPPLPASESEPAPASESEPDPAPESETLPIHQPGQPNTSQTDQYQGQGVRICRIVEDLQAKSVNLPKLKNFIEDFVVTAENLHNTALPGALSFSGGNDQYISLDNAVGLLSASVDGTVKLWSAAGLELKTLSLGSQGMNDKIEHISFNSAGTRMAVARSPQSGQRGWIELWHLQGQTLDAMQLLKVHDLRSDRPIRDDKAAIGSLGFSDNFFGQGEVILALSTDGYLDIWRATDGTLLTPPLDVVAQELALLPSQSELKEEIDRLNQRISSLEQDITEELQRYWQLDQSIPNEEKQKELQRYWQLKDTLDTVKAERTKHESDLNRKNSQASGTISYTLPTPLLIYSAQHEVLLYSAPNSLLVLRQFDGTPTQINVPGITAVTVAPNGQEIALSAPDGITFWKLDNTQQPRWLPANGEQVLMYGADSQRLMAISAGQVRFWEDVLPESSRNSYPIPYVVNSIIAEPSANTRITSFALSADRTVLVVALSDGRINLCRYGGYRSNRVKTLVHGGVVGTLHNPTALGAARPNPFSFVGKAAYTLELRVQPHLNASGSMLAKGSRIGLEYEISVANGRFLVAIGEHTTLDGGVYQSGRFTHLAVVVQEGLAPAIYQDGEPVKQEVRYGAFSNPNPPIPDEIAKTPLLIGGSITDNYPRERVWTSDQAILSEVPSFGGMISEVRIWNVARSQGQIQADQNRRLPLNWAKAHGLVGYWRFEETQDNQIINLVGDGDYGMIVGAEAVPQTDVPQRFVSGLQLPSPSSEVNCGHDASLATPTAITVEAWVKHHFGDGWIVHRLDANKPGYALAWRDNKIRVILQSAKAVTIVDTQQPAPSDRAFHHIAFAWAQAFEEMQIYIDGRRQDTVSIKGDYEAILIDGQYRSTALFKDALATVETPLVIGKAFSSQAHRSWVMAEVRLWNVARTQNQIQFMMAKHIPHATPGLVGYWRLDDGGAIARNRVADWQGRSGPGHHGNIQAAQWFPRTAFALLTPEDEPRNIDPPVDGPGDETPVDGPGDETPVDGPGDETPVDGPGDETPVDGPGDETPVDGPGDETPVDGPGDETPVDGPGDETPVDGPGDEIPVDGPGNETPVDGPGDETPVDGPGDETPVDGPADIQNHWAQPFIEPLLAQSIFGLNANGAFRPDEPVTLGEYAIAIAAAFNLPPRQEAAVFSNLAATDPNYDTVQRAYRMGFLLPKENAIEVQQPVTRLEAMVYFVRGFNLKGGTRNLLRGYPDRSDIPNVLQSWAATALRHGLVVDPTQSGRLEPHRPLTRSELAVLIYQGWVHQGQREAIASPRIIQLREPLALFTDVLNPAQPRHWAEAFIRGLVDLGLINGFDDDTFRPEAAVARVDYAGMLVAAFDPPPRSDRQQANVSRLFRDVAALSTAQFKVVDRIYRSGAMSGFDDGTFGVTRPISREQAIAALVNILNLEAGDPSSLNRYPDRATLSPWATGAIAAATEAGLIVSAASPAPGPIRAKEPATRADVAALVYQGLVSKGIVPPS